MKLTLSVENPNAGVLAKSSWDDEVVLVYRDAYADDPSPFSALTLLEVWGREG